MEERKHLTKEQRTFYLLLKKMHYLEVQEDPDTAQIKKIKLYLWDQIKNFAWNEMKRMAGRCTTYEERLEIQQDMALIFFEKLPYYDPLRSTPTTFFVRYFREKISKYIRTYKVHMTQYDTTNARAINAVIAEYNKKGIAYTLDMLSTKTGLSQRVIKSTIQHSANAKRANIDDEEYTIHKKVPLQTAPAEAIEKKRKTGSHVVSYNPGYQNTPDRIRVNQFVDVLLPTPHFARQCFIGGTFHTYSEGARIRVQ